MEYDVANSRQSKATSVEIVKFRKICCVFYVALTGWIFNIFNNL